MFWFSENISAGRRLVTFSACTSLRDRGCYLATLQSKLRIFWGRGSHKAENLYHNQKNTFDKNFSNNQWRHRMSITFRKHQLLYSDWDWCGYIVFLSPSLPETHSKKQFSYLLIHKNIGVVQLWTNFDYSTDQFNPAFKIFLRLCRPNWDGIHEPPQNILMTILLPLQQNFIQYDLQTVAHF